MNGQQQGNVCLVPRCVVLVLLFVPSVQLSSFVFGVGLFPSSVYAQGVVEQYIPSGRYTPSGSIVEDSAVLAGDVYTASNAISKNGRWVIKETLCAPRSICLEQEKAYEPPKGYRLISARSDDHGFGAAVYEETQTGQRTVAFEGTGDLADVQTDAEIVARARPEGGQSLAERLLNSPLGRERLKDAGYWDAQITQSLAFFAEAQKIPPTNPAQTAAPPSQALHVTGHSLGGGLAQLVGAKHHVETHTFNAVGVPEDTIKKYVGTIRTSLPITNHIRRHDLVGNFGKHLGATVTYPDCEQGGKGGLLASPSVSGAAGTGAHLLQNHSTGCFVSDFKFNDKMKGQVSTDRELEQQRAEQAGQEPPTQPAPRSKPADVVDARFSTCLAVSRGARYQEPKKTQKVKDRYVRVEDYIAVTITNSCGKTVKATNICQKAGLNPSGIGLWPVNHLAPGSTTWKVECWEPSQNAGVH
jgi:hypothetical protein